MKWEVSHQRSRKELHLSPGTNRCRLVIKRKAISVRLFLTDVGEKTKVFGASLSTVGWLWVMWVYSLSGGFIPMQTITLPLSQPLPTSLQHISAIPFRTELCPCQNDLLGFFSSAIVWFAVVFLTRILKLAFKYTPPSSRNVGWPRIRRRDQHFVR